MDRACLDHRLAVLDGPPRSSRCRVVAERSGARKGETGTLLKGESGTFLLLGEVRDNQVESAAASRSSRRGRPGASYLPGSRPRRLLRPPRHPRADHDAPTPAPARPPHPHRPWPRSPPRSRAGGAAPSPGPAVPATVPRPPATAGSTRPRPRPSLPAPPAAGSVRCISRPSADADRPASGTPWIGPARRSRRGGSASGGGGRGLSGAGASIG